MSSGDATIYLVIDYQDLYIEPIIWEAIRSVLPEGSWVKSSEVPEVKNGANERYTLQFRQYEDINFEYLLEHPGTALANAYVFRKGLVRKHYLSFLVLQWRTKHPKSILTSNFKHGESFELDYAEFLDDALVECWDLKASLAANAALDEACRQWWILKPGMSDKGQGIRLFSSMNELETIFLELDENEPASDDEEGRDEDDADGQSNIDNDRTVIRHQNLLTGGIVTSHLRHFFVQPYIHPPLLIGSRKFHVRVYVACIGAVQVYVSKEMLALFAGDDYRPPWEKSEPSSFLTNTCLQQGPHDVRRFWDLPLVVQEPTKSSGDGDWKEAVWNQICEVTAETFKAATLGNATDFQPLPNAFEIYGLDFLVDIDRKAWLLEVNAFPDFAQTGTILRETVFLPLFEDVLSIALDPFTPSQQLAWERNLSVLHKVADIQTARR